jgi:steroid delta-isomerase-like uncharacterized protein
METTAHRLKEIVKRWLAEGWQKGRARVVDELHTPDFVDHDAAGRSADCEGFKAGITEIYRAFPDFFAVIEDLAVEPETGKVAVRWSATGTHRASFMGYPPTHRRIYFKGIEIVRVENDRIAERWGEWDGIYLLHQLGMERS